MFRVARAPGATLNLRGVAGIDGALLGLSLTLGACSAGTGGEGESGGSGADAGAPLAAGASDGQGASTGAGSGGSDDSGPIELGSSGGGPSERTCGAERASAEPLPVDLMILLDQSGSMTLDSPNRWDPVTAAMKGFVDDPTLRNLRLGLQYFPLGATTTEDPAICLYENYLVPDVLMQGVPGASAAVVASIDAHYFTAAEGQDAAHWGTPTRPALVGTYDYLRRYATDNPGSSPILVLATDGKPSKLCYDDGDEFDGIAEITYAIGSAATAYPPIRTYVIGIGEIERLDEWAQAGGTGHGAFIVNASDPSAAQSEFKAAMDEIRKAEIPCEYPIPPGSGGYIDLGQVNVEFSSETDDRAPLAQVPGASSCTSALDWHYDDAAAPTSVVLCPSACSAINDAGGAVEVVFGCQTSVR